MSEFEIDLARVGGIERRALAPPRQPEQSPRPRASSSTSARSFPGIADLRAAVSALAWVNVRFRVRTRRIASVTTFRILPTTIAVKISCKN